MMRDAIDFMQRGLILHNIQYKFICLVDNQIIKNNTFHPFKLIKNSTALGEPS